MLRPFSRKQLFIQTNPACKGEPWDLEFPPSCALGPITGSQLLPKENARPVETMERLWLSKMPIRFGMRTHTCLYQILAVLGALAVSTSKFRRFMSSILPSIFIICVIYSRKNKCPRFTGVGKEAAISGRDTEYYLLGCIVNRSGRRKRDRILSCKRVPLTGL